MSASGSTSHAKAAGSSAQQALLQAAAEAEYPLSLSNADRLEFEDEQRSLPAGWIRQFDRTTAKHFYVHVVADPPRAIWCHPNDEPAEILDAARRGV